MSYQLTMANGAKTQSVFVTKSGVTVTLATHESTGNGVVTLTANGCQLRLTQAEAISLASALASSGGANVAYLQSSFCGTGLLT
jgi:hypothetical protein